MRTKPQLMKERVSTKGTRPRNPKGAQNGKIPAEQGENAKKEMLLKMRSEILSQVSRRPLAGSQVAIKDAEDEADLASNETSRELLLLLSDRNREKVLAINEALDKIAKGTYGICEECGAKIEPARLKALPLATFCVHCMSEIEKEMKFQRAREEEAEGLPFHSNEGDAEG